MFDGPTGSADSSTTSLDPAPNAGAPINVTRQDSGSHNEERSSWVIGCVRKSVMPALRNCSVAHSTALPLDGKPEMRPHICPLPISLESRAAFAMPTSDATSALIVAPLNSEAGSPLAGRGGRVPTITAGAALAFGGSVIPNHGPSFLGAGRRAGSSWADADAASDSSTRAVARQRMTQDSSRVRGWELEVRGWRLEVRGPCGDRVCAA